MRVVDVTVPVQRASQPLGGLELRGNGYLVLGVRHMGKLEVNPGPETLLKEGSVLIVLASVLGKHDLEQRLAARS
jgi:K+/H+ antiporter YhaU regulatory subunit KhtT